MKNGIPMEILRPTVRMWVDTANSSTYTAWMSVGLPYIPTENLLHPWYIHVSSD